MLPPTELVDRAAAQGVNCLSLTDHDTLSSQAEAAACAHGHGMDFVPGVEVSITWNGATVHIVGLRVDPDSAVLLEGLAGNRAGRVERARRIAESLAAAGIAGAFQGAMAHAAHPECVSRTHFARFLVQQGVVKNVKTVFKKFLVKGKPGYVSHAWASLGDCLAWIRAAGGQAVLAHPGRYAFGKEKLRLLVSEFRDQGGAALEVVSGTHTRDQIAHFADMSVEFGLLASVGSDFHAPGEGGRELGRLQPLPSQCRPVWSAW
ncbi:MAG: PHP domain-containing protein [Betaproteobacteria bacterium]|nr:PHP domain-containing protein [Betaproteobacteria bacterium]